MTFVGAEKFSKIYITLPVVLRASRSFAFLNRRPSCSSEASSKALMPCQRLPLGSVLRDGRWTRCMLGTYDNTDDAVQDSFLGEISSLHPVFARHTSMSEGGREATAGPVL